jgi:hypothetical protein
VTVASQCCLQPNNALKEEQVVCQIEQHFRNECVDHCALLWKLAYVCMSLVVCFKRLIIVGLYNSKLTKPIHSMRVTCTLDSCTDAHIIDTGHLNFYRNGCGERASVIRMCKATFRSQ